MSTQQNHTEAVALKVLRDHADAYYLQGSGLVERADVLWEQSKDPDRDEVERAAARHEYLVVSARAQSKFKRHDVLLDVVARREALRDL